MAQLYLIIKLEYIFNSHFLYYQIYNYIVIWYYNFLKIYIKLVVFTPSFLGYTYINILLLISQLYNLINIRLMYLVY
jgi:hypothetical protein